ncbi:MAG: CDP-alcohol phosphatidyltransferase family protein [Solirubrobacteraceae bacterium]
MSSLTEGERWTRNQLRRLRARRFSRSAIGAFLRASHRRARETRRARPVLARQARRWIAAGAAAWPVQALIIGAAGIFSESKGDVIARARRGLAWWLLCGLMLDWHLGMVETVDGDPRELGAADALTLARAWLAPIAWQRPRALSCLIAGLTDALDGELARRAEPTRAGRDLEGLVDACFASAALRGAWRADLIARPALAAEGLRLSTGMAYGVLSYFLDTSPPKPAITRAARALSPLRSCGLIAAAVGHRRSASTLLGGGALASSGLTAIALRNRAPKDGRPRG